MPCAVDDSLWLGLDRPSTVGVLRGTSFADR
jgi:hypothetical protein